jgi:rhodanese-related sulfurtransferase
VRDVADAHPLTPRQLVQARDDGGLVVDVRTELQFDEAHVPGAVSITTRRAGFGSKLAWLASPQQPLVFVGRDDEDALEAIELAGAVGLRTIGGYLAGGMTAWREERLEVMSVPRMTVPELFEQREAVQVLDVRERAEWDTGRIPGSVHIPYHDIDGIPEGIDGARPIAAICGSGQRSAVAASLLQRAGAREVIHVVDGGVGTWQRAGWPIES